MLLLCVEKRGARQWCRTWPEASWGCPMLMVRGRRNLRGRCDYDELSSEARLGVQSASAPKWGSKRVHVVDAQTGILLRVEQFRFDGAIMTRDVLLNVQVYDPIFSADFRLQLAPGERLLGPGEEP